MAELVGARAPSWSFMHLNRHDEPLGLLDGVSSMSGELVAQSRLGGSASLRITDRGQDIDWLSDRVHFVYDPGDGTEPWSMGVWMFTSPKVTRTAYSTVYDVTVTPKTTVIDSATVSAGFSIPAGTNVVQAVVQLIEGTGETRIAATESDKVTSSTMVWGEGAPILTVVNDLLTSINYWSLWTDRGGQFRVEPYVDPASRPVAYSFRAGNASVHKPEWVREFNQSAVPNVFRVYCEGDEEAPPINGVYENLDPESPYSIPARGFEVSDPPERVEVATVAEANELAKRRLIAQMAPVARLDVTHALLPLDVNSLVEFRPSNGPSALATIQRMSFTNAFNAQCDAEWREVML